MIEIKKLKAMPYAQAHVEINDTNVYLFSYCTLVAKIENNKLEVLGLYSQTTRKHISAFVKEYAGGTSYQTAKQLYQDHKTMDILTGEVEDIE